MMFQKFVPDETECEGCTINRNRNFLQQKRKGSDMVLMPVGKDYPLYFFLVVENVGKIGNDKINTKHILFREHKSCINDDDVIAVFKDCHVEAYLLNTAKGNHRQDIIIHQHIIISKLYQISF